MNVVRKERITGIISLIGVMITIFSLSCIYYGDLSLNNALQVNFEASTGDNLIGIYYPGSRKAGIVVLEGFGSDQIAIKGIASEFSRQGFHVFTFDFSGHGRSPGKLYFNTSATNRLALQLIAAKEKFKELSGLEDNQLLLLGHSMGARVALQSATFDPNKVSGLILFGVQVNLDINVQSMFFTGVNDADLKWVQELSINSPPVDILIISGSWDDILTPSSARLLYQKLGGKTSIYSRDLIIIDNLFHSYEIYSHEAVSYALNWGLKNLGIDLNPNIVAIITLSRNIFWLLSLIGLFLMSISGARYFNTKYQEIQNNIQSESQYRLNNNNSEIHITTIKKFLLAKLLLWFAALPITLTMFLIFIFIPLGVPILNLIYVGFIGGYGILMIILYKTGKIPHTQGTLTIRLKIDKKRINKNFILGILSALFLIIICTFFANSGLFYLFALNDRIFWLVVFTIFTIPGFYISQKELSYLKTSFPEKSKYQVFLVIIGLVPFFIFTILFLALGSLSGMLGGFQGLIILGFVITGGNFVQNIGKNSTITILFQSFLIQYLVLPLGVLFAIF